MNFSSAIASCGEHAWFCKIVADGISRWVAGDTDPKSNVFALALNKDSRKLKHMRQIQTLNVFALALNKDFHKLKQMIQI